jgi:RNA polymerase-binding transcription factor DksA
MGADDAPPEREALGAPATPTERLLALRATTVDTLAALEGTHRSVVDASRDSNADDEHDPEGSTIAFERAQVEALAREAAERIDAIDAALARAASGTYGVCELCGRAIPDGRLEARPMAATCVECAGR